LKYEDSTKLPNTPLPATESKVVGEVDPIPTRPLDVTVKSVVVARPAVVGPSMFRSARAEAEEEAEIVRRAFVGDVVPMPTSPVPPVPKYAGPFTVRAVVDE
jgi:hypothetical protein